LDTPTDVVSDRKLEDEDAWLYSPMDSARS
jgi:hypothetical protein